MKNKLTCNSFGRLFSPESTIMFRNVQNKSIPHPGDNVIDWGKIYKKYFYRDMEYEEKEPDDNKSVSNNSMHSVQGRRQRFARYI